MIRDTKVAPMYVIHEDVGIHDSRQGTIVAVVQCVPCLEPEVGLVQESIDGFHPIMEHCH